MNVVLAPLSRARYGVDEAHPNHVAILSSDGQVLIDLGEAPSVLVAIAVSEFLGRTLDLGTGRRTTPSVHELLR